MRFVEPTYLGWLLIRLGVAIAVGWLFHSYTAALVALAVVFLAQVAYVRAMKRRRYRQS